MSCFIATVHYAELTIVSFGPIHALFEYRLADAMLIDGTILSFSP
jgi:hypothetical protein